MKDTIVVFITTYERFLMPATLLGGVFVDFITFTNISVRSAIMMLCAHLLLTAIVILLLNIRDDSKNALLQKLDPFLPYVFQFSIGALLSASFVFYWFSGTLSVSWPFMILLAFLMLANESFRHYFEYIPAQVGVYFFACFSVSAIGLTFLLNSLSVWVFVMSVAVGFIAAFVLLVCIARIQSKKIAYNDASVVVLFIAVCGMGLLYFSNLIPPIPLAIRDAGIAHSVTRVDRAYRLVSEVQPWWYSLIPGDIIHVKPGGKVYAFVSVFAPADLSVPIYHHWEYFNATEKQWESVNRVAYTIWGGRTDGYRGYSYTSHPRNGKWRVRIETERGQVLGQINLRIHIVDEDPEVITIER